MCRYTHGPTGLLDQNRNGTLRWHFADALGSVWALTNSYGGVTDKYAYNAYGECIYQYGPTENHARFIGEAGCHDDLNGLVLMGYRYYDPALGRFITQDPMGLEGGDLNFYAYCGSNPMTGIDPSGLVYDYDPASWNQPEIRHRNNCYSYAIGYQYSHTRTGEDLYWPQPGDLSGGVYDNRPGYYLSGNNLAANANLDYGLIAVPSSGCPEGYHKVCLYIGTNVRGRGPDYHWYRQDSNGYWSNKPGLGEVTNVYYNEVASSPYYGRNVPITDPDLDAALRGYGVRVGSWCTKDITTWDIGLRLGLSRY